MKNKLTVLALAAVSLGTAGCLDLVETPVSGVTGEYFATPEGADAATSGAYARLRDYYGQQQEIYLGWAGTDVWKRGQQLVPNGAGCYNDYTPQLSATGCTNDIRDNWQQSYFAINSANTAIKFIGESTALSETIKNTRLGEMRFIRALFYHNLVRNYGAVHLALEPTEGVVVEASRTAPAEIYAQAIIPDLEFAVANLPATQQQRGRATRGAAQTLLAEVYLTRGAAGDFDRARDLATAVINSGTYSLAADYRSLFCGPERPTGPCDFAPAVETNAEYIFQVQFSGDGVQGRDLFGNSLHWYITMAYDIMGAPNLARTLEYGRPFRRVSPTRYTLDLWNRSTDARYNATFQTVWRSSSGAPAPAAQGGDTAIYLPGTDTVDLVYRTGKRYRTLGQNQYTEELFPSLLKWQDQTKANVSAGPSQRDRHLWRLADVYLLRAEANIRAGRGAEAIADFNVLRRRGAWPGMGAANELTAAQADSARGPIVAQGLELLLNERARELTGEEQRWYVLQRTGKLGERVRRYNPTGGPNFIEPKHLLRPIPQQQIDATQGNAAAFPQNPGY
ncbi:RagB/SusD family nutrient uptake outer membrane protein [Longimicrobium sp.]|uniref:RagB/SusD family nutrient uptake outer membrane protein n=1 Tax=Longimicrobium sp. TaxID=2029185 RepID=UPI002E3791CE|nr:RagB/SusD family nutrient uptake outer membrane protein [Longimicrobium sp.]HEX6041898.1 RagB/SusD family nutrient uptake outer membrane protein [Longimicrobium sp.]